jgi:hypothetical protein
MPVGLMGVTIMRQRVREPRGRVRSHQRESQNGSKQTTVAQAAHDLNL